MSAPPSPRFHDRVAIVTGALGGIGLATAKRLAQEGAIVLLADLPHAVSAAETQSVLTACRALGAPDALAVPCDVSDEAQVAAITEAALQRFGRLDVIVNVAGMMIYKSIAELTGGDWQTLLGVNLMGAVHFTRLGLRHMRPGGAIVNVSSIHAIQTSALVAPYAAAKAALLSLTRSTAIEGKPLGIRANAVLPGAIDTPMLHANPNIASGAEVLAPGDVGTPGDIAAIIGFLASSEAAFVTGAAFLADGGRLANL